MPKHLLKNKRVGQSMLDSVLILLVIGLVIAGYGTVSNQLVKKITIKTKRLNAGIARHKIISYFDDPDAWKATYNSILPAPVFPAQPTAGSAAQSISLKIYIPKSSDKTWYSWDSAVSTNGFDEAGTPCGMLAAPTPTFPSTACPYSYSFQMRVFPAENFGKELIELTGIFNGALQPNERYNFRIYKTKPQ